MTTSGRALSIAAMSLVAAARCSGVSWSAMRVQPGDSRDLPDVDDDTQEIDDFLHICVAEIERLHDGVFVLRGASRAYQG